MTLLALIVSGFVYAQPGTVVGTDSGQSGTMVTIPVSYLGTGSGVVGIQMDMNFDNTQLTADLSGCGATLGDADIVCTDQGGNIRFAGLSFTLTEIPSGSLGNIVFTIDPAAVPPATLPLTVSGEVYGNAAAMAVPPVGTVDGQVNVIVGPQPAYNSNPASGSSLNFAAVVEGEVAANQVIMINNNAGDAGSTLIGTCAISGVDPATFTVISGSPFSVAMGAGAATVTTQCSSATAGSFAASLDCSHNGDADGDPSPASYPLACTVTPPGAAIYSSVPPAGSTIAMTPGGAVPVNAVVPPQMLVITNAALLAIDNDLGLEGCAMNAGATITATPTPLNATLAVGPATATVTFNCPTTAAGSFSDTYSCPFSTDGVTGNEDTADYTVTCEVRDSEALGSTNPADMTTLNITAVPGGTADATVIFMETNNEGTDITDLNCLLVNDVDFAITAPPTFPVTIPSGGNLEVVVTFTDPADNTAPTDTLSCTFTDVNGSNSVSFPLTSSIQVVQDQVTAIPTMNWMGYVILILILSLLGYGDLRRKAG
jgi:hypothetical protein